LTAENIPSQDYHAFVSDAKHECSMFDVNELGKLYRFYKLQLIITNNIKISIET
jgi:hypothetical protein